METQVKTKNKQEDKGFTFEEVNIFPDEKDLLENKLYKLRSSETFKLAIKIGKHIFILNLKESEEYPKHFEFLYSVKNYGYAIVGNLDLEPIILSLKEMIKTIRDKGFSIDKIFFEFANVIYTVSEIDEIRKEIIVASPQEKRQKLERELLSEGVKFTLDKYSEIFKKKYQPKEKTKGGREYRKHKICSAFELFNQYFIKEEDVENGIPCFDVVQDLD